MKDGASRGLAECQKVFGSNRWNCPVEMYKKLPIFDNTTFPYGRFDVLSFCSILSVKLSCIYLRNKNAFAARVFYIPVLFSNAHHVLSWQCDTPIKLLHLLYDIDFTRHDRE